MSLDVPQLTNAVLEMRECAREAMQDQVSAIREWVGGISRRRAPTAQRRCRLHARCAPLARSGCHAQCNAV